MIGDDIDDFVADMVSFGLEYAAIVRDDHRHFVEAFREGRIPGVTADSNVWSGGSAQNDRIALYGDGLGFQWPRRRAVGGDDSGGGRGLYLLP